MAAVESSTLIKWARELNYTPEVRELTAPLYEKMKDVVPHFEWPILACYIAAINQLKRERNAVILAHNYMTPDIFHGVADLSGDSLALAKQASETDADIIIQCGVHFMAETAKILNPNKTVLIPDLDAGCSLAESITPNDVRTLREKHPGVPVVTYVNTTAEVKAECDICCTSSNAVSVVESLGSDRVIFLPDQYLGKYVASKTDVDVILWEGTCMVHERFTADDIHFYREQYPGIYCMAHPECPPDVLEAVDFVGSTSGMIKMVGEAGAKQVVMITECSMSANIAMAHPDIELIRPCQMCPHMKKITLPKILDGLENLQYEVLVDPEVAERARRSVERMISVGRSRGM